MTGTLRKNRYNEKQEKEAKSFQYYFLEDSFYAMEINIKGNNVIYPFYVQIHTFAYLFSMLLGMNSLLV